MTTLKSKFYLMTKEVFLFFSGTFNSATKISNTKYSIHSVIISKR